MHPPFDIDFVWTWCSHNSNKLMQKYKPKENELRLFCANVDDIKYSIRAAHKNAPFFRYIVLIIGDQDKLPDYINTQHPQLQIVRHSEFIPNTYLPTFNSNVVESFIHKIPFLARNFLYFNDDTYIAKPVTWRTFFNARGQPINRHAPGPIDHSLESHPYLYVKMFQNAIQRYDLHNTRAHIQVQPFNKDIIKHYESKYNRQVHNAAKHRYRQPNDFNLLRFTTSLSSTDGNALRKVTTFKYDYFVESSDVNGVTKLYKAKPTFICINNNGPAEVHVIKLQKYLFSEPSVLERYAH